MSATAFNIHRRREEKRLKAEAEALARKLRALLRKSK